MSVKSVPLSLADQDPSGSELSLVDPFASDDNVLEPPMDAAAASAGSVSPRVYEPAASAGGGAQGPGGTTYTISTPGSGLVFVNTYALGDTQQFINDAVAAEKVLEAHWITPITINVNFEESDLGYNSTNNTFTGAENFATGGTVSVTYAQLTAALKSHNSGLYPISLPGTDPNPAGGADWTISEAYARMLGLSTSTPATDVTVELNDNSNIGWSYTDDVINVITHELSENGLGRVGGLGDQNSEWSTMDLFRYSAAGVRDYTDGRDGKTTYFSADGVTLSSQSFNNQYSGSASQNTGDTADFTNNGDPFGVVNPGETSTISATDIQVMDALGWTPMQEDFWGGTGAGNWTTASNWHYFYGPAGALPNSQDAWINFASGGGATVTSGQGETVNSIGTNIYSSLTIAGDSTFVATNGTVLNPNDAGTTANGNDGAINVDTGSTFQIGNAFDNAGSLTIGVILSSAGGDGSLVLSGAVTLNGGGKVYLGQESNGFQAFSGGAVSGGGLINVDNSLTGGGSIILGTLDNQAGGTIDANQEEGNWLQVSAGTFSNEGTIIAESLAYLEFGQDGVTRSLANSGTVDIEGDGALAIAGAFSISGAGTIQLAGDGAEITSDFAAAATLTNRSQIVATANAEIGDAGLGYSVPNDLTFDNSGTTAVSGKGATLTLDTGGNAISDGAGTLEAESGGDLVIDSTVDTGVIFTLGHGATPGTVEASSGGVVTLAAAIQDGIAFPLLSRAGEVVIDGGIFDMLAGSSDSDEVEFTANGGVLELRASTTVGTLVGLGAGASIELEGFDAGAVVSVSGGVLTITDGALTESLTLDPSVTYAASQFAVVQVLSGADMVSLDQSFTGGGLTFEFAAAGADLSLANTGGDLDKIFGSNGTINLAGAQATIIGADDRIIASGADDEVKLFSTGGQSDKVFGSNLGAYVIGSQASFIGADDSIRCTGADDQLRLFSTGAQYDKVFGIGLTAYVVSSQAHFVDGGDVIHCSGSDDVVKLFATLGDFDKVFGTGVNGYLINAQASFIQGGDTIHLLNGQDDTLKLLSTGSDADSVYGSGSTIDMIGAQATITGSGDRINMFDNDTVTLNGGSHAFVYQPAIGDDTITGFAASDTMQFSAQDFASWSALQGHISQAGANTVISLDANDMVTLNNVTATSLSASQFKFV